MESLKKLMQIVFPIAVLVLGYAETMMKAFAAENGAFVALLIVRIGIGVVLGILLCFCISAKKQSPGWPAISMLLFLVLLICYVAPTGLHRYLPSLPLLVVGTMVEGYLVLKAWKRKEKS